MARRGDGSSLEYKRLDSTYSKWLYLCCVFSRWPIAGARWTRCQTLGFRVGQGTSCIDVPALTKGDLPGSADSPDASEKLPYGVGVSALAFSPDGISLAVGYVEGTVRMMNLNR